MNRSERLYKIDQLLQDRKLVPLETFLEALEVSLATVKRDLSYMRNRLHAPIVWDQQARGYRFGGMDKYSPPYALPGLWFNATEIHALLTMQHLLTNLQPGLLGPHIEPLQARLNGLLETNDHSPAEIGKRIRILQIAHRAIAPGHFELVASAVVKRRRLFIVHYSREHDNHTEREISPQRLVFYRDNWYLDAWCHLRKGIRSFAIDAISNADMLPQPARAVSESLLNRTLGSGYGIFSGAEITWARLRFTPERTRWIATEIWHPSQKSRIDADGCCLLEIPYSDTRELIMDILKYGPDVEVLGPAGLRKAVAERLAQAADRYKK